MNDFPLHQWFDLSKKISKDDVEIVTAEIYFRAYKEDQYPKLKEIEKIINNLKTGVKEFNKKFKK